MKKLFTTLAFITLILFVSKADSIDVNMGPIVKGDKKSQNRSIVGADAEGYYVLRVRNYEHFFIDHYTNANLMDVSREIELKNPKGEESKYEMIYFEDGEFHLFTSYYDKKGYRSFLYVQTFDKNLTPASRQTAIDEVLVPDKKSKVYFEFKFSPDKSKILICESGNFYKLFDLQTNNVLEKRMDLPDTKPVSVKNYGIDNDGNIYVLVSVQDKIEKQEITFFEFYRYDNKEDKWGKRSLSLDNVRLVKDLTFTLDSKNDKIIIAGFYANREKYDAMSGTLFMRLDKSTLKVEAEHSEPFKQELLESYSKRAAKKGELNRLDVRDMILKENGEIVMVSEYYLLDIYVQRNQYGTIVTKTYVYGPIILFDFTTEGNVIWSTPLYKIQSSTDDFGQYSSFCMNYANGKFYLWFNATKEKHKERSIMLGVIDENGKLTEPRSVYDFTGKPKKLTFKPKTSFPLGPNEKLIYAEVDNNYKFGRIKIQD